VQKWENLAFTVTIKVGSGLGLVVAIDRSSLSATIGQQADALTSDTSFKDNRTLHGLNILLVALHKVYLVTNLWKIHHLTRP